MLSVQSYNKPRVSRGESQGKCTKKKVEGRDEDGRRDEVRGQGERKGERET